jgi:hypothetical protein
VLLTLETEIFKNKWAAKKLFYKTVLINVELITFLGIFKHSTSIPELGLAWGGSNMAYDFKTPCGNTML